MAPPREPKVLTVLKRQVQSLPLLPVTTMTMPSAVPQGDLSRTDVIASPTALVVLAGPKTQLVSLMSWGCCRASWCPGALHDHLCPPTPLLFRSDRGHFLSLSETQELWPWHWFSVLPGDVASVVPGGCWVTMGVPLHPSVNSTSPCHPWNLNLGCCVYHCPCFIGQ